MKARRVGGGKFVALADDTTWVDPTRLDELNWQLRYAPSEANLLLAADALSSFRALLGKSNRRRNEVCNAIKRAL